MEKSTPKTYKFKAEIKQLLDILVHSLYTNREIFVRELISNAADALDKVRFETVRGTQVADPELPFEIRIELDKENKKFTITDTGIGMSRDELVKNIGTIAYSGSAKFLEQLQKDQKGSIDQIGRFGVGFYSVFMAGKEVKITTRSANAEEIPVQWHSDGLGSFEISPVETAPRGTKIEVFLRDDAAEFGEKYRIENVIKKYSNFVPFPIYIDGEQVNKISAIWREPKSSIKEDQYTEFFKFLTNTSDEPLTYLHFSTDAPIQFSSLIFIPQTNYEIFGMTNREHGVNLFAKRILVQTSAKDLLPEYLRFMRGVVDSEDLPLNISRETLQENMVVSKISSILVKRILSHLSEIAEKDAEKYHKFWKEFGRIFKEGHTDFLNRDKFNELLRFNSSTHKDAGELTSLTAYIERMKEGQKDIYYLSGPSREAVERDPHLEIFKQKGIEILYLYEPLDEFVMTGMHQFKEKNLISADQADLSSLKDVKLGDDAAKEEAPKEENKREFEKLCRRLKDILGDKVEDVRLSERLTDSPAVLVSKDGSFSSQMQRLMTILNKDETLPKKIMEVNAKHTLIQNLFEIYKKNPKDEFLEKSATQLFLSAQLVDGYLVDPHQLVQGTQELLKNASSWYLEKI
ncbi:molecular chaperone HtpG [candidate division KSB1 bacterium]|nr:molecular chaperone HtpG [candidate division KSB1 bacterium]